MTPPLIQNDAALGTNEGRLVCQYIRTLWAPGIPFRKGKGYGPVYDKINCRRKRAEYI